MSFRGVTSNHPESSPLSGGLLFDYTYQEVPRPPWR
jgi:hypothetical protein